MTFAAILYSSIYFSSLFFYIHIYSVLRNSTLLIGSVKSEGNSSTAYSVERERDGESFHRNFITPFPAERASLMRIGLSLISLYFSRAGTLQRNSHPSKKKKKLLSYGEKPRPGIVRRVTGCHHVSALEAHSHTALRHDGADGRIGRGPEYECRDLGVDVCDVRRFLVNKGRHEITA